MPENPLKIAMLAPISWPVPPSGYGPWEQVTHNLTEGLVSLGHDVTLFAARGSQTSANLIESAPHPLNLWPQEELSRKQMLDDQTGLLVGPPDFRALEQTHIATCMEVARANAFDIVHSHLHVHALVFSRMLDCPLISTLHGSAWVQSVHPVLSRYQDCPFVSISNAERQFMPNLNYVATIYNGIDVDAYPLCTSKDDYLLFSGRLAPEKGAAEAVRIARYSDMPLKIAGMIEERHRAYYDAMIAPNVDGKHIEYVGLLSQEELIPVYQRARACLCPIHWAEPFGLVGIEAMACGTPMIGTRRGAFVEIVEQINDPDEPCGYLFDTLDEAVELVQRLDSIRPEHCRNNVVQRFSRERMAQQYAHTYKTLAERAQE